MDEKTLDSGLHGSHTPRDFSGDEAAGGEAGGALSGGLDVDPARAAKIGAARAGTEAAMADLAAQLRDDAAQPEQQSLMLDEIDERQSLFSGPVRHVADKIAQARTGRGRPKGAQNKASRQFAETLMRMGYRHPGLNLAALANADPRDLAAELSEPYYPSRGPHAGKLVETSCTPGEALALILKANAELLPYFESKRPTEVQVNERVLGIMAIGRIDDLRAGDDEAISLTHVGKPE